MYVYIYIYTHKSSAKWASWTPGVSAGSLVYKLYGVGNRTKLLLPMIVRISQGVDISHKTEILNIFSERNDLDYDIRKLQLG
jgi:hypothetical protein